MKRFTMIILALCITEMYAQNLQLHYDLGEDRNYFTSTFEMYKPDEYGATFMFIDFDFNFPGNNSISLAYFEIARYFSVYRQLSLTLQYNDGVTAVPVQEVGNIAVTLNQTWLAGISVPINLGFVTLNTDFLFRKTYRSDAPDGQITVTWFVPFLTNKFTFTGFLDIWTQDELLRLRDTPSDDKEVVFLAEPQLWYNVWRHLSLGTEIEISNNFLPFQDEVKVMPTLAARWNF